MRKLAPGTRVRSLYRSRWTGVVVLDGACLSTPQWADKQGNLGKSHYYLVTPSQLIVRITHDKNGYPMRKSFCVVRHRSWFELLDETTTKSDLATNSKETT